MRTLRQERLIKKKLQEVKQLEKQQDYKQAIDLIEKLVDQIPKDQQLFFVLGSLFLKDVDLKKSTEYFTKAQHLDPKNATTSLNLATLYRLQGEYHKAQEILKSLHGEFHHILPFRLEEATLQYKAGEIIQAIKSCEKMKKDFPKEASLWFFLGYLYYLENNLLLAKNHFEESLEHILLKKAHQEDKDFEEDISLISFYLLTLLKLQDQEGFEEKYRLFSSLDYGPYASFYPSFVNLLFNEKMYPQAFHYYYYRFSQQQRNLHRMPFQPHSLQGSIKGKEVLIFGEQGVGDELFFARYLPELLDLGAKIHLYTHPKLKDLFKRHFPSFTLHSRDEIGKKTGDIHLFLADLPLFLKKDTQVQSPFSFQPSQDWLDTVQKQLAMSGPPPYYAFTWEGGDVKRQDNAKILPLKYYLEKFNYLPGTLVLFQRNLKGEDFSLIKKVYKGQLLDASSYVDNLEAALALMHCVDDYITLPQTHMYLRPEDKAMKVIKVDFNQWRVQPHAWLGKKAQVYELDWDRDQFVKADQIFLQITRELQKVRASGHVAR